MLEINLYYYKCPDIDDEFHEIRIAAKSLKAVAEFAAEKAFCEYGMDTVVIDGESIEFALYGADKNLLCTAKVYCYIPEPEFSATIAEV